MKEIVIFFTYMILTALIGGFHVYGKLTDSTAAILFIGIFLVPFAIKLLFLPRKKQE